MAIVMYNIVRPPILVNTYKLDVSDPLKDIRIHYINALTQFEYLGMLYTSTVYITDTYTVTTDSKTGAISTVVVADTSAVNKASIDILVDQQIEYDISQIDLKMRIDAARINAENLDLGYPFR